MDRQTLWNAVESAEKNPKAQLAYSFDIALQNELSIEENKELAIRFCRENLISDGMIVDLCIHSPDKNGGIQNPHFHILCPMRPLKENGEWGTKQRRVYALNENGNRIRDGNGKYIFTSENTTDWDDPKTLEHWRKAWADLCNSKFEEKGLDCRIDHRTLEAQGVEMLPTIHEGPTVRAMEQKGKVTEVGSYNKMIRKNNYSIQKFKSEIAKLDKAIFELKAESEKDTQPLLLQYLQEYYQVRNEYATQNFGYGANKAKVGNLQSFVNETEFLSERRIYSVADLESYVSSASARNSDLAEQIRKGSERISKLKNALLQLENYHKYKPIADELNTIKFKGKREKFQTEHNIELAMFYMAKRVLKEVGLKEKDMRLELERLTKEVTKKKEEQGKCYREVQELSRIAHHVREGQRKKESDIFAGRRNQYEI